MVKVCEEYFKKGEQSTRSDGYYMNKELKENFDLIKKVIKKDWDMCVVIDGAEGAGKSVLTQQLAFYCDPTLNIDRITFRPDEFKDAVLKAERYNSVIFDEAYGGLSSRRAMTATNNAIVDMLTEIRQKNLFLFIVLPSFFDLDKYVALWRSRALINVYHDKFERGFFNFFSAPRKKNLYVYGKKFYNYHSQKPNFTGRFTNFYPVDKEEYRKKKLDSLRAPNREQMMADRKRSIQTEEREKITKRMKLMGMSDVKIAEALDVSDRTIRRYKTGTVEGEDGQRDSLINSSVKKPVMILS